MNYRWLPAQDKPRLVLGAWLHVPKKIVNPARIRSDLTVSNPNYWQTQSFDTRGVKDIDAVLELWREEPFTIAVPRHYVGWSKHDYSAVLDRRWTAPHVRHLEHRLTLRNVIQENASLALQDGCNDKIVSLHCGAGKGLPNSTEVLTPAGWRNVGEIRRGDHFIGADGKPTRVIGVYPQGRRPCFRITFSDNTNVVCDDQHLWEFTIDNKRKEVWSAAELSAAKLTTKAGKRFAIDIVAPVEFSQNAHLPIDPWLLGVVLGDGTCGSSTTIANPEKDIQRRILKAHPGRLNYGGKRCPYIRLQQSIVPKLASLGLVGCHSYEKFIPHQYLRASVEDRVQLLRGLFDTDGHVTGGNDIEYASSSKLLIEDTVELVRSLGGVCSPPTMRIPKYTYKGEKLEGRPSWRIHARFPRGDFVPVSSKKHLAKWEGSYQRRRKYVQSIERVEDAETTCFEVESKKKLFVAEGYNLTHNTCVALHAASEGYRFPTLIVVHTTALLEQWMDRIVEFYGIERNQIGHVQADKETWRGKSIAVAMLQSLVLKEYSKEFFDYWRLVIYDETHILGGQLFGTVAPKFRGERWGLSATVKREDGMEKVFKLHLGEVAYEYLEQPLKPKTIFVKTGISFPLNGLINGMGRVNMGRLQTKVSDHIGRTRLILDWIQHLYKEGRTILVLGERLAQLHEMYDAMYDKGLDAALHVGSMPQEERSKSLKHRLVFASQQLAKEGLDRPAFDTLVIMVPFKAHGRLQQSIGRILRIHDGKKDPLVLIFEDNCSVFAALAKKMRRSLSAMQFTFEDREGGPNGDCVRDAQSIGR